MAKNVLYGGKTGAQNHQKLNCTASKLLKSLLAQVVQLSFYLPPAGREIIKRIPCVCSCVIECVSRFYKGLYITLVVSPWPFQCFL